ncbi:MAG: hypothetical protein QM793_14050 [Muricomes sp.]
MNISLHKAVGILIFPLPCIIILQEIVPVFSGKQGGTVDVGSVVKNTKRTGVSV